jgi:RHS repeat-associated protein
MLREHTGTEVSNYKFTDQELDPETGLYNYDARLYDPVVGTFISPDPTVPRPFDPQSLNRFAYARNNPLRYIDPTGYEDTGEHDHESYGGDSNSGGSGNDYGNDPGLNTGNKQAGFNETNTSSGTVSSTEAGSPNETGPITDYSEPPEASSNPANVTNTPDDNSTGIIGGIAKALNNGFQGAVSAFSQAAKDIANIAYSGSTPAQVGLTVAVATTAVPAIAVAVEYAAPVAISAALSNPQAAVDFANSMFPGTTPSMNYPGLYGAATGQILGTDKW